MTKIQKERVEILNEASFRMEHQQYQELSCADIDELVMLYKAKSEWTKKLNSGIVKISGNYTDEEIRANNATEEENKRIEETYIKPLEHKIKLLEVEIILFYGMFEMESIAKEIHERVYPNLREED